jgi:hypothetical protein
MAKYRILTNNGLRLEEVETTQTLDQLQKDLNDGLWLLVNNRLINPTIIDTIVEVANEEI